MRYEVLGSVIGLCAVSANAHLAVYTKGMWCENGPDGNNIDSNDATLPLYELEFDQWWFHAVNGCKNRSPSDGEMMELPAGQSITVEIATNQANTELSHGGQYTSDWADGGNYPDDYNKSPGCIVSPNMHTQNQSMAAGTALAISYQSDINNVTPENLAVFSVRYHTPWKRLTTYDIPADLPPCPEGGCICAWGWIPNGCGQANMYHEAIRCTVTGSTSTRAVAAPKAPVWCEDEQSKCVQGSKQMLYWHQASGNNIEVDGQDLAGDPKSPAYNAKCGFSDGAQNDIFGEEGSASSVASSSSSSSSSAGPSSSSAFNDNNAAEVLSSGFDSNANSIPSADLSDASSRIWPSTADATTLSATAQATPSSTYEAPYNPTSAASPSFIASATASAPTLAGTCRHRERPLRHATASHRRHRHTHGHNLY